jgi:serine/threonine-protein kinase
MVDPPHAAPELITDLAGLQAVRDIGKSRFGTISLMRRPNADGGFDCFAVKRYNAGRNCEGGQAFADQIRSFLELSHPHVMPIVGVIPPKNSKGPILLTPYSELGSLEDVLERVRRNDAPAFWNDSAKVRMIVSLVSGLHYLHSRGIVHQELKPTDLIVGYDGSVRICGYATTVLEKQQYTKASQVGHPSYMAPEIYDDLSHPAKVPDPKSDVFSFGLILYELVCGSKVFPSSMPAVMVMRRAMSAHRLGIPADVHPVVRELNSRSWVLTAQNRPSFAALWKQIRDCEFKLFPAADVCFIPATAAESQ